MKDLTKVIDTLDSIQKVMGCMKEHLHDGIMVTTINTEYRFDEFGVSLMIDVENKVQPKYENRTVLYFDFDSDYLIVKDIIIGNYNRMCVEMRANIEEDKRLKNE